MSQSPDPNQRINIDNSSVAGQVGQAGNDLNQVQGDNNVVVQGQGNIVGDGNIVTHVTQRRDERELALEELLQECTVKLSLPGKDKLEWSNGFFVAPGKILTDGQWLKNERSNEPVQVKNWQGEDFTACISGRVEDGEINLVLLELSPNALNHPCVFLDKVVQPNDKFYSCVYSDDSSQGISIRGQYEGKSEANSAVIKFRAKPSSTGLNGAPLLNTRTGKVCGIVKQVSNQGTTLEGISAETILGRFSHLKDAQSKFHQKDNSWSRLLPLVRCKRRTVVLASLGMSVLVILMRSFQIFQPLELGFYDSLIRNRFNPPKPTDRFLIVKITKQDAEAQEERGEILSYSLSNVTLAKLLQKAQTFRPTAIGLDIYREQMLNLQPAPAPTVQPSPAKSASVASPAPLTQSASAIEQDQKARQELSTLFQQPNLFAVCKVGDDKDPAGISPPPHVKLEQVGFSDFSRDIDGILRRQILAFQGSASTEDSRCTSTNSFGLTIAKHYLQSRANIKTEPNISDAGCQISFSNGVVLKNLQANTGGYQGYHSGTNAIFDGCQILLNYREQNVNQEYATMSLQEFLTTDISKDYYNRIILIGIDRLDGIGDNWRTPYDQGSDQVTPGVIIQAQMIDQILNVAAKKDTLIWVSPGGVTDLVLILVSALLGGIVGWWYLRSLWQLGLFIVISCGSVLVISFVSFQYNRWVPLMPHFLALTATSSCVWWANQRLKLTPVAK